MTFSRKRELEKSIEYLDTAGHILKYQLTTTKPEYSINIISVEGIHNSGTNHVEVHEWDPWL